MTNEKRGGGSVNVEGKGAPHRYRDSPPPSFTFLATSILLTSQPAPKKAPCSYPETSQDQIRFAKIHLDSPFSFVFVQPSPGVDVGIIPSSSPFTLCPFWGKKKSNQLTFFFGRISDQND